MFNNENKKVIVLWVVEIKRPIKSKFGKSDESWESHETERKCLKSISFSETKTINKIKQDLDKRLFTQEAHSELMSFIQQEYQFCLYDSNRQLTAKEFSDIVGLERNSVENGVLTVSKHDKNMNRVEIGVFENSTQINLRFKNKEEVEKLLKFWAENVTFEED